MYNFTKKYCYIPGITLILLCCAANYLDAQESISVSGSWSETIDVTDLTGGPGSDLNSTYTSASNVVYHSISSSSYRLWESWDWRVDVRRSDINWDSRFQLYVRRSSNGIGFGSISGGTAYQLISTSDQQFYTGTYHRYLVGCQFELRNVSVQIPADDYTTTVIYTITDTS